MSKKIQELIKKVTGADEIKKAEVVQKLWSDYGQILRFELKGSALSSIIVKQVLLHEPPNHPKGWKSTIGHQRKLKSYQVETAWYQHYSASCDESCRIPKCLSIDFFDDEVVMVLEDLNAAGYPERKSFLQWDEIKSCLKWLANFHATFLHQKPVGLWEIGTYWHLETRQEELEALSDLSLKEMAFSIDKKLKASKFQTLVHGDAKVANFCFSKDDQEVAAVDFQYVGAGCGMKDLAYFIGSCLDEEKSAKLELQILDCYFEELHAAILRKNISTDPDKLEEDWRSLFHVAWADFHRFLKGWSPGHWKINSYSEHVTQQVISQLQKELS
ncbi:DUF1679 domain-containing protein [Cytophagaceae bacterium ABcell3]|nr:DUF1679 domain-containing protein [Cytophagaceae bacterium ABcell3]